MAALVGLSGVTRAVAAPAQTSPATAAIVGTVYDSVAGTPLAGALVQLASRTDAALMFSATADSLGRFRISGARPGRYIAGLLHPTMDLLGLDASMRVVDVTGDSLQRLDLVIRNDARTRALICGATIGDSAGVLVGQVRDADTDAPLNDARVVLSWQELFIGGGASGRPERRTVPATVRPGGYFAICGLPADDDLLATAEANGRRSGELRIRLAGGHMTRRDFTLGTTAGTTAGATATVPGDGAASHAGRASVSGIVHRPDGRPAGGVIVLVVGTDARTTTGDDGRFTMAGLPSGTYALEARAIGFQPATVPVALTTRRAIAADIVLGARVASLETVRVLGRGSRLLRAQREFFARMQQGGSGKFVTADQLERLGATRSSDALQTVPGIVILDRNTPPALRDGPPRQVWMRAPMGNGFCRPSVYIDGFRIEGGGSDLDMLVLPMNVLGYEVYRSAMSAPAEFAPTSSTACGVILVWTKP